MSGRRELFVQAAIFAMIVCLAAGYSNESLTRLSTGIVLGIALWWGMILHEHGPSRWRMFRACIVVALLCCWMHSASLLVPQASTVTVQEYDGTVRKFTNKSRWKLKFVMESPLPWYCRCYGH